MLVVVRVVVRDQFRRLGARVGDQPGGAVDNPMFTLLAPPRFRLLTGDQQQVLHLGHGVHRVDERQTPQVGELQPGHAGNPVVRMDHVVAAVRLELPDPVDFGHHAVQQFRQFLLGQLPGRSGQDVVHADAGGGMFDGGLRGGRGPGEDLHFDAGLGEGRGEGADVDVHAAGVPGTGLLHGRGVQGEEGDAADQRHSSPPPWNRPCRARPDEHCRNCISVKHYS